MLHCMHHVMSCHVMSRYTIQFNSYQFNNERKKLTCRQDRTGMDRNIIQSQIDSIIITAGIVRMYVCMYVLIDFLFFFFFLYLFLFLFVCFVSDPMFRFLIAASPDCKKQDQVTFDLRKVAYLARQRDQLMVTSNKQEEKDTGPKVLNVTAVAFHESRCGSTLVANSMIAMDPEKHRAYSESSPPVSAFHICGDYFDTCSQEQAATILRDTIYLMSRTDDHKEERVFFKFQSITSKAIPTFQMAFPNVPWMYVYRDPVQVMMSHVKDDPALVSF